jgi:tryptophan-rich sensory protein
MKKILLSIFRICLPIFIGSIIGLIISNNINYTNLIKPPLSPPKIIFPIAWTIIYILMGISYYIYRKDNYYNNKDIFIYYLQLFINSLWSIIFFIWKLRLLAVIWIIILLFVVILLLKIFYQNNKLSFYLNIPYLIWIIFATYLTIGIYILN